MKWIDTRDIAERLCDLHPDIDPQTVNFVTLRDLVLALDDFDDSPERCGEKILESIQQHWIEESE